MSREDKYNRFAELASDEQERRDYRRLAEMRDSAIAIIAPHGGGIEPGTSEITKAIADSEFAFYCFEGIKLRGNEELHITSTYFDEPICIQLIERSQIVVTVHGCAGEHEIVYVGGLDDNLRTQIIEALKSAGFKAKEDISNHEWLFLTATPAREQLSHSGDCSEFGKTGFGGGNPPIHAPR